MSIVEMAVQPPIPGSAGRKSLSLFLPKSMRRSFSATSFRRWSCAIEFTWRIEVFLLKVRMTLG